MLVARVVTTRQTATGKTGNNNQVHVHPCLQKQTQVKYRGPTPAEHIFEHTYVYKKHKYVYISMNIQT